MLRFAPFFLAAIACLATVAAAEAGVPDKFVGAWGRDNCTVLVIRFGPQTFASPADGPPMAVTGVIEKDGFLDVTYNNPDVPKPVTDTYAVTADGRLQLLRTTVDGNVLGEFHAAPWDHCP